MICTTRITVNIRLFNYLPDTSCIQSTGSRLWNSLPPEVPSAPTPTVFRNRLKTHLFSRSFPSQLFSVSSSIQLLLELRWCRVGDRSRGRFQLPIVLRKFLTIRHINTTFNNELYHAALHLMTRDHSFPQRNSANSALHFFKFCGSPQ